VAQVVELLPGKHEALSSTLVLPKSHNKTFGEFVTQAGEMIFNQVFFFFFP
jgi:hypothetical protein